MCTPHDNSYGISHLSHLDLPPQYVVCQYVVFSGSSATLRTSLINASAKKPAIYCLCSSRSVDHSSPVRAVLQCHITVHQYHAYAHASGVVLIYAPVGATVSDLDSLLSPHPPCFFCLTPSLPPNFPPNFPPHHHQYTTVTISSSATTTALMRLSALLPAVLCLP